jgi:hypothetical protein
MTKYRLKETHPTMQKVDKLWRLADELGISLHFCGHCTKVLDKETGQEFDLEDLEKAAMRNFHTDPQSFPPPCEYILTFEKDGRPRRS